MDGVRLSQLSRCPRQCAYGALGTLEDERPYDLSEAFFRGKVLEAISAERARAEFGATFEGAKNIERQVPIAWPLGEGHADIYVRSERLLIEAKSSISDSDIPLRNAIRQLQLYVHFHPEAERGEVWWFNPRTGSFKPTRFAVEGLDEDLVGQLVAQVKAALDSNGEELPLRVCGKPSDAGERLCPFTATCFAGWQEPVAALNGEVPGLAAEWYALKREEKRHEVEAKAVHEKRVAVEAKLREVVPVGKAEAGDFLLNRIHVSGRESLSLKKPRAAGLWTDVHDEVFAQFVSISDGYDRFDIQRAKDPEAVPDEDEVPF